MGQKKQQVVVTPSNNFILDGVIFVMGNSGKLTQDEMEESARSNMM